LRLGWVQVRENVGKWLVKSDKVKERALTLSDVREGSSYEFRVSAVNKAGQGPASAPSAAAKYGQQPAELSRLLCSLAVLDPHHGRTFSIYLCHSD